MCFFNFIFCGVFDIILSYTTASREAAPAAGGCLKQQNAQIKEIGRMRGEAKIILTTYLEGVIDL